MVYRATFLALTRAHIVTSLAGIVKTQSAPAAVKRRNAVASRKRNAGSRKKSVAPTASATRSATAVPEKRDVREPLLFECAWEVANKGPWRPFLTLFFPIG